MLYIRGECSGDKYEVVDTDDGVKEIYSIEQLFNIYKQTGIKIYGVDTKSKTVKVVAKEVIEMSIAKLRVLGLFPKASEVKLDIYYRLDLWILNVKASSDYMETDTKKLKIPDGVECLLLFADSRFIREVKFPRTLRDIKHTTFNNFKDLRCISGGLKVVPEYEFCKYDKLEKVDLRYAEIVGKEAFEGVQSLRTVRFGDALRKIGNGCFSNCHSLKTVDLSLCSKLRRLPVECFQWCEALENVKLPKTLTGLSRSCFQYCEILKEFEFPENCVSVGLNCFGGCLELRKLVLPRKFNLKSEFTSFAVERLLGKLLTEIDITKLSKKYKKDWFYPVVYKHLDTGTRIIDGEEVKVVP